MEMEKNMEKTTQFAISASHLPRTALALTLVEWTSKQQATKRQSKLIMSYYVYNYYAFQVLR